MVQPSVTASGKVVQFFRAVGLFRPSYTPEFKEKYKKRAAIESKNAEMKRFYGMSRARGWGLKGVTRQVKLTAIAVNLRAIARIA